MSNDKEETKKTYMKQYYAANKERMVKQIMTRQKLLKNSDALMEGTRDKIIEELNSGKRKYLQMATLDKYSININPKTLKYDHDTPTTEEPTIEEPTTPTSPNEPTIPTQTNEPTTPTTAPTDEPATEPPTLTTSKDNLDEEQDEQEESMTAQELILILELNEITDEDKSRIQKFLKRKKNKRKITLIREIRDKFNF